MKKIALIILMGILGHLSVFAEREIITTDKTQLPTKALSFIEKNFPETNVYLVKIEKNLIGITSYDVTMENGCDIEFDKKGEWTEVDCQRNTVPESVIPTSIKNYVERNYKGQDIVSIEKDKRKYEVKLSNRQELIFDYKFNFLRVDD